MTIIILLCSISSCFTQTLKVHFQTRVWPIPSLLFLVSYSWCHFNWVLSVMEKILYKNLIIWGLNLVTLSELVHLCMERAGAPNVNFLKIPVWKTIWDLEFCCKISCLPASPRIFKHLKNGIIFEKVSFDPYNFQITRLSANLSGNLNRWKIFRG